MKTHKGYIMHPYCEQIQHYLAVFKWNNLLKSSVFATSPTYNSLYHWSPSCQHTHTHIHTYIHAPHFSYSSKRASINKQKRDFLLFFQTFCPVISRVVEGLLILMLYGRVFRHAADGLFAWTVLLRLRGDDGQREVVSQSRPVLPVLTGVSVSPSPHLQLSCMEMHMCSSCRKCACVCIFVCMSVYVYIS